MLKRTYDITIPTVVSIAEELTGYGSIDGLTYEGVIQYSLEAESFKQMSELERNVRDSLDYYATASSTMVQTGPTDLWLVRYGDARCIVQACDAVTAKKKAGYDGRGTTAKKATPEQIEAYEILGGKVA